MQCIKFSKIVFSTTIIKCNNPDLNIRSSESFFFFDKVLSKQHLNHKVNPLLPEGLSFSPVNYVTTSSKIVFKAL